MQLLFEHERAVVEFNEELNTVVITWRKAHDSETYRLIYSRVLEFVIQYKVSVFLSDIKHQGIVAPANAQWMQTEIIPKAVQNGLKKILVVLEPDIFKKFYLSNIEKAAGTQMMEYFDSMEAAYAWIRAHHPLS